MFQKVLFHFSKTPFKALPGFSRLIYLEAAGESTASDRIDPQVLTACPSSPQVLALLTNRQVRLDLAATLGNDASNAAGYLSRLIRPENFSPTKILTYIRILGAKLRDVQMDGPPLLLELRESLLQCILEAQESGAIVS